MENEVSFNFRLTLQIVDSINKVVNVCSRVNLIASKVFVFECFTPLADFASNSKSLKNSS